MVIDVGDRREGPLLNAEQTGRDLAECTLAERMIERPRRHLDAADAHHVALIEVERPRDRLSVNTVAACEHRVFKASAGGARRARIGSPARKRHGQDERQRQRFPLQRLEADAVHRRRLASLLIAFARFLIEHLGGQEDPWRKHR